MISNLKVDIIYYKTSSDFELEFNLNGCCRMRILKEKVENKRELFKTLARDVSRSRIIIMVTDLVGAGNGVETLCSAIGYKYVPINKVENKIKSGDDISIPMGALPLVTKAGQYGGCIVECGPQSIIVVSSDRNLRHEVMRSYIHQYIFDINQVEAYNERKRHESENNPVISQSNILSSAREEEQAEETMTEESLPDSEGVVVIPSADITVPPSIDIPDMPVSDAADDTENQPTEEEQEPAFEEDEAEEEPSHILEVEPMEHTSGFSIPKGPEDIFSETESGKGRRIMRRRKGGNIALLIIAILLLVCFGVLAYFLVYLPIIGGEMPNSITKILEELL